MRRIELIPTSRLMMTTALAFLLFGTAACEAPTSEQDTADEAEEPQDVETSCAFSEDQAEQGISFECTIEGEVADVFIDPLNPSNQTCTPNDLSDAGLLTLADQEISVPVTMILGAEGDDVEGRIRIDVQLNSGSHTGELGKTPPSCGLAGIKSDVTTSFSGLHKSLIDRESDPYCIRHSTYEPSNFSQTLDETGPGVDIATRAMTERIIAQRVDLEIGLAVNNALNSDTEIDDDFRDRFGRCDYAYGPFED
ncbi:MAG: hypothetical protein AAGK01_14235 [Pseudomonadota bacterium]